MKVAKVLLAILMVPSIILVVWPYQMWMRNQEVMLVQDGTLAYFMSPVDALVRAFSLFALLVSIFAYVAGYLYAKERSP